MTPSLSDKLAILLSVTNVSIVAHVLPFAISNRLSQCKITPDSPSIPCIYIIPSYYDLSYHVSHNNVQC